MRQKAIALAVVLACQLGVASAANASETITYGYDAKGRLVQVAHAGSVNNALTSTYTFDQADNRTNITVDGATYRAVVVLLGGFKIVPIDPMPF